jgi:drug/metabolite transporter (DMT)-like permease
MFQKYKYHILLHFIIFLWGFTGILGKLIHLDFFHIVWNRVLIALVGLGIILYILKKPIKINSTKQLLSLFGVGLFVALHWLTFYKSIQLSTASLGILCLSTTTLHVTWLEPLVMKKKFSWIEFFLGLLVIGGIYIVSSDFNPKDYEALIYGLLSALFAALFSVFNGYLVKTIPSSTMTFYELLMGFVFISGIMVYNGDFNSSLFKMTTSDFLWLLFLGLICTSFAFLVTIDIVKKLGAFTVSLSINLEPVYTMILAIVILNENEILGSQFYLGALLIIAVVLANPIIKYYTAKESQSKN